jgi:hypothetical protein
MQFTFLSVILNSAPYIWIALWVIRQPTVCPDWVSAILDVFNASPDMSSSAGVIGWLLS